MGYSRTMLPSSHRKTNRGVSRTATKIARFMLLLDAVPRLRGILPADAASSVEKILRASGAVRPHQIDIMRRPLTLRLVPLIERLTGRGQVLWFGLRKRWIAETVEEAIRDGAQQVLVVGAGFDPLALMIARRHPQVLCVEIDAPATATPKAAGVRGAGFAPKNHLVCAADLSRSSLTGVLDTTPWRTDVRSIVVAEGLLMYLQPTDVAGFFRAVQASTGAGTRIAFTSVDADDQGQPRVGVLDRPIRFLLRLAGEAMHWGLRPRDVPGFLASLNYQVLEQPPLETLRKRYLEPLGLSDEPVAPYEHLILAEVTTPPAR
jgi:methyltransferase (TIGR00027 family)